MDSLVEAISKAMCTAFISTIDVPQHAGIMTRTEDISDMMSGKTYTSVCSTPCASLHQSESFSELNRCKKLALTRIN